MKGFTVFGVVLVMIGSGYTCTLVQGAGIYLGA